MSLCFDDVRGGGAKREQWRSLHSPQTSILHSATHNQTGPLWCWFLSGWACARPRPLWVSLRTSPVRLGVSPAAAPTPTGVFNQRFEALFPCEVCLPPQLFLLVYLHMNVGPPSPQSTASSGSPAATLLQFLSA